MNLKTCVWPNEKACFPLGEFSQFLDRMDTFLNLQKRQITFLPTIVHTLRIMEKLFWKTRLDKCASYYGELCVHTDDGPISSKKEKEREGRKGKIETSACVKLWKRKRDRGRRMKGGREKEPRRPMDATNNRKVAHRRLNQFEGGFKSRGDIKVCCKRRINPPPDCLSLQRRYFRVADKNYHRGSR